MRASKVASEASSRKSMRSCSSSWKVRYCSRMRKSAALSAVRGSARPSTGIGPVNVHERRQGHGVDDDDAVDLLAPGLGVELGHHLGHRGTIRAEGEVLEVPGRLEPAVAGQVVRRTAERPLGGTRGGDQLAYPPGAGQLDVAVDGGQLAEVARRSHRGRGIPPAG